ncbi:DUF4192 domain-containing protein [Flindersiella endophytica]
MNRDSTKPQTAKPPAGAPDAAAAAPTQSNRDGPPGASMWLRTPEDVLARIPFAIGFHPTDSLVVIAVNANGRSDLVVRADLRPRRSSPIATDDTGPAPAATRIAAHPAACDSTTPPAGGAAEPAHAAADAAVPTAATITGVVKPPHPSAARMVVGDTERAGGTIVPAGSGRAAPDEAVTEPAGSAGEPAHAATTHAITADAATAGFGRITTDHESADPATTLQLGSGSTATPAEDDWPDFAHQLAAAMVHNGASYAVLVAYTTSADLARRSTGILAAALAASGIGLLDALWVDGSRWRSLSCHDPHCCPTEGRPYDAEASRVAAESVYHGEVAFAGEAELRRSIAPTRGLARIAMRRATARMDAEASRRYLRVENEEVQIASSIRADGKAYVMRLVERYLSNGTSPTDDEVAWAGMYLYDIHVRDAAWLRMTTQTAQQHVQLWREIARRALPPYNVAPLALLAFAAWLSGDGPLARCAVDRVLDADPTYSMAHLIRDVVAAMVPPSVWPPDDWPAESREAGEAKQPQTD